MKHATISSILKKTVRYFDIVLDISPFKRYLHCILHPERYARQFHRRKEQTCAQNATISSILKKTVRYFDIVGDISTFNRLFHTILRAERSAHVFQRRNKPRNSKIAMIRRFCRKLCVISLPS